MAITEFQATDLVTRLNVNEKIQQINSLFPVSVANGGTGATTANGARTNLGFSTSTNLYTNLSGTFSTITLSSSISNYDAIGIYYFWDESSVYSSNYIQILPSYGKLTLTWIVPPPDGNGVQISSYEIAVSGSTITFASYSLYKCIYITASSTSQDNNFFSGNYSLHTPYITKVVGYKY